MIFDIQRFSTHDGPGIRTVVFFKGCPLRCSWCENPESQSFDAELLYKAKDCLSCHSCLRAERAGALRARDEGGIEVLRTVVPSAALDGVCPAKALRLAGREMTVADIMTEVQKDRDFYASSGGGLTLSGGEPLAQVELARGLIEAALGEGIDTAVETCLTLGRRALDRVIDLPVRWLVDLKHLDPSRFREGTGGEVSVVLDNLRYLAGKSDDLTIRVPLVPGFNDDLGAVRGLFEFALVLPRPAGSSAAVPRRVDLLPYHDLGAGKYAALGRPYPYPLGLRLERGFSEAAAEIGRGLGLDITIGG